jgi:hypothetical protein
MKTFTYQDVMNLFPCYSPGKFASPDWSGTALDILNMHNIPHKDQMWVVLRDMALKPETINAFLAAGIEYLEDYHEAMLTDGAATTENKIMDLAAEASLLVSKIEDKDPTEGLEESLHRTESLISMLQGDLAYSDVKTNSRDAFGDYLKILEAAEAYSAGAESYEDHAKHSTAHRKAAESYFTKLLISTINKKEI